MRPTRLIARPMLAAVFVSNGIDVLRNPAPQVAEAEPLVHLATQTGLPKDAELLVRANAATQVVAGTLLSFGKLRRLSALALMASLAAETYVHDRFWEADEPDEKLERRSRFMKDLALCGGLVLEVVDTEGRPSWGWRSRQAARRTTRAVGAGSSVALAAKKAAKAASAVKGADAVRELASDRLRPDAVEVASRAKDLAGGALKARAVTEVAAKSKDLAGGALKAKLLKDVADRARHQDFDMGSARNLAGKAAKTKAARAAVQRIAG